MVYNMSKLFHMQVCVRGRSQKVPMHRHFLAMTKLPISARGLQTANKTLMATTTHVRNEQLKKLGNFLREHGVSDKNLESFLGNKQKLISFCDELKDGESGWFEKLQIAANKIGGRVHVFHNVTVDYARSHNEAALAGGPQTPENYDVLKVGDQYKSPQTGKVVETLVAFNWSKGGGSYDEAVTFGLSNGLERTISHETFAIGEHYPKLNYELGPNPMYVIETTGCSFDGGASACLVWWSDAKRRSSLSWQSDYGGEDDWFLFRKVPSGLVKI